MGGLPLGVGERPCLIGLAARGTRVRVERPAVRSERRHHFVTEVVERHGGAVALGLEEPHAPIGAHAGLGDEAGRRGDRNQVTGSDLVAVQPLSTVSHVLEEHRGAVRPPCLRPQDSPFELDLQVRALAGAEVPDARPLVAVALVHDRQPLVAGHR